MATADIDPRSLPARPLASQPQPMSTALSSPMNESSYCAAVIKRPIACSADGGGHNVRTKRIRRRSAPHQSHQLPQTSSVGFPTVLLPTNPLPLAVYQPASLFAMLLVAALLPRNTFSLRWLALSGGVIGGQVGLLGRKHYLVNNGRRLFSRQNDEFSSSSWLSKSAEK